MKTSLRSVLVLVLLACATAVSGQTRLEMKANDLWVMTGDSITAPRLLVVTVLVGTLDNVLRPALIKKGADLPLLLVFAGVIGGLIAFGLIGVFVGPMVLAVTYTLLSAWIEDRK